jgi:hypothetical protein
MSDLTRAERAELARLEEAAEREWMTRPARSEFLRRFDREADPEGVLAPEERARRVKEARRAYFTELGRRSAEVRWGRARRLQAVGDGADEAEEQSPLEAGAVAEPGPDPAPDVDVEPEASPWNESAGRLF